MEILNSAEYNQTVSGYLHYAVVSRYRQCALASVTDNTGDKRFNRSQQRLVRYLALALVLALSAYTTVAGAAPDAGSFNLQLRQQQQTNIVVPQDPHLVLPDAAENNAISQPPPAVDATTVIIRQVVFSGLQGSNVSEQQAQHSVSQYLNKPLTFPQLRQMIDEISLLCHTHDMPLAQAILPPQTIADGTLQIQVVAGHYDSAAINNHSLLRDVMASNILKVWTPQGKLVQRSDLQHAALLLSDIPGVNSQMTLSPGLSAGTSAVNLYLTPARRYAGYLSLDNQGDPSTGRSRIIAGGYVNQLLGTGDQLQINLLDAWQKNSMFNGLLDYGTLFNGYGSRAGLNYSHLHYHYTLTGTSFSGYSNNWNLYFNQPWRRRPDARVDIRFEAGQQLLSDFYPVNTLPNGHRTVSSAALMVQGSVAVRANSLTAFSLRGTTGNVLHSGSVSSFSGGNGSFARVNYFVSHLQQIHSPFSFFISVKGQMPDHNMDSSQKFLLGGSDAVRAYDIGNGVADSGTIVSAELRSRWGLPELAGSQPELNLATFYDQGWGRQYKNNRNRQTGLPLLQTDNTFSLAGAGLWLSLAVPGSYSVTLSWAHRTGAPDPVSGWHGRDRLWLSAIKAF